MFRDVRKTILLILIVFSFLIYLPVFEHGFHKLFVAQFIGLVGLQLVWWQVMLGDRLINRLFTRDLLWLNHIHQLMGKYGFLIIALHPPLMILSYQLNPFAVSLATNFDRGVALGKLAFTILAFVWLTSAIIRSRMPWRWWKRLHLLAYLILPILFVHATKVGSDLQAEGIIRTWVYFLIVGYVLAVLLRLFDWSGFTKHKYRVVRMSSPARNVSRIELESLDEAILPKPGQFAYFQTKPYGESHPFTISHFDNKTGEISFSPKAVGPFSSRLQNLKPGDTVYVDGPFGVFTQEIGYTKRPVVAIAGGIGITPFIRWVAENKIDFLFYGAQTANDIAYKQALKKSKVKVVNVLSNQNKPGFAKGYVSTDLIKKYAGKDLGKYEFFVCGPEPMMDSVIDSLAVNGVPAEQIHCERFSL